MTSSFGSTSLCSSNEYYSLPPTSMPSSPLTMELVSETATKEGSALVPRSHFSYDDFGTLQKKQCKRNKICPLRSFSHPSTPTDIRGDKACSLYANASGSKAPPPWHDTTEQVLHMQSGCQGRFAEHNTGHMLLRTSDSKGRLEEKTCLASFSEGDEEQQVLDCIGLGEELMGISSQRPDHLPLGTSCQLGDMSICCRNIKECWMKDGCKRRLGEWADTPTFSLGEISDEDDLEEENYHGDVYHSATEQLSFDSGKTFSGSDLLSWLSYKLGRTEMAARTNDDIIQSFCTELINLKVLQKASTILLRDRSSSHPSEFQPSDQYQWGRQSTSPISPDQKMKKLRHHNINLKSRLKRLTEKVNQLTAQADASCKCAAMLASHSAPCQIEVHTEGRTTTSLSMPSKGFSISTQNSGSGSHISLSIKDSKISPSGYGPRENSPSCSTPPSCESFTTAMESPEPSTTEIKSQSTRIRRSNSSLPVQTKLDDKTITNVNQIKNRLFSFSDDPHSMPSNQHSQILTKDLSSITTTSNDLAPPITLRHEAKTSAADDIVASNSLCDNCQQLMTARSRLSNASIDSGLSQSCSAFPSCTLTGSESAAGFYQFSSVFDEDEESVTSSKADDIDSSFAETPQKSSSEKTKKSSITSILLPPPPPPLLLGKPVPRKKKWKPRVNLKPLHWRRILLNTRAGGIHKRPKQHPTVWEKMEEPKIDTYEIEELFSLDTTLQRTPRGSIRRRNFTKVLEHKRSQNLAIVLSGIRQPFPEIKKALINFDVAFLGIDTWRSIYDARGTEKEMTEIQDQVETSPRCVLDKPEQFLFNLNELQFGTDRIKCFLLRAHYEEVIKDVEAQLKKMAIVCNHIVGSDQIGKLLSYVLAVGNYLNGGNEQRGQADGYALDVLPKLKHIRGKKQTTLLQYIASKYGSKYGATRGYVENPLPSISDLVSVSNTSYEDLDQSLSMLNAQIADCKALMVKVETTLSDNSTNQVFYDVMSSFIDQSTETITQICIKIADNKTLFQSTCQYFSAPDKESLSLTPEIFFEPWVMLAKDLHDVWDRKYQTLPSRASAHF